MKEPQNRYKENREEIERFLLILKEKLEKHNSNFQENPKNWGYVGDLSYIKEKLEEITNFINS